jgi:hypothetical protein
MVANDVTVKKFNLKTPNGKKFVLYRVYHKGDMVYSAYTEKAANDFANRLRRGM